MSVLITGGAGYIGSHMAHHLIAVGENEKITILDNLWHWREQNMPHGVNFYPRRHRRPGPGFQNPENRRKSIP